MNPWDEATRGFNVQEIVLKKIKFALNQKVTRGLIESVEVDEYTEMVSGVIVYRVQGYVYGEQRKQVVEYPRGWWQAFKESYFPAWLLAKFPVVYTKVEVNFDIVYPDFEPNERLGEVVVHSYRSNG